MRGTIKTLKKDKAFGFIRAEGTDYFFHKADLGRGVDFNSLQEGQMVEFEEADGDRGPRAREVELA